MTWSGLQSYGLHRIWNLLRAVQEQFHGEKILPQSPCLPDLIQYHVLRFHPDPQDWHPDSLPSHVLQWLELRYHLYEKGKIHIPDLPDRCIPPSLPPGRFSSGYISDFSHEGFRPDNRYRITVWQLFPAVVSMGELQKCQDPVLSTYPVQILLRFLR